jgi:beta-ureidopropionase
MLAQISVLSVLTATILVASANSAVQEETTITGKVKVAAICIGTGGDYDTKMAQATEYLQIAGDNNVDIACLPEEFASSEPESIPGRTTDAIAKLAKQYNMYVICPICELAGDRKYNTAVLIDRHGDVAGYYRKVFVFWGEGVNLSDDGVKIFDTDFGRISILTCFDLNFAELWHEADAKDAEIVFWPSAYGGGMLLNAYAMLYHYYIVPVGWGNIIDVTGENMKDVINPKEKIFIATLDTDRTFIHENFTGEKVTKLLEDHKGEVVMEHHYEMEAWWLLKSVKPGVSVRKLCKEYGIETLREYQHRSREQINEIRKAGGKV